MLKVHHLENSRSQRVLWLLEELGVPYEIVKYQRYGKAKIAPPELEQVHPLGKSPVITDGDKTIAESGLIIEYLVDKYGNGRFVPAQGSPEYWRCRYFMHYAEGSLMPFLLLRLITTRMRGAPFLVRPIANKIADQLESIFVAPNLKRHVAFVDSELAKSPYFAGPELTIADIQMLSPMQAIEMRVPDPPARIRDWLARVRERPAFQRALERAGPHDPATNE